MRLIDADAFENKEFNVYDAEHEEWYRAVKSDDIDNAPTIDAVPVVRCMDCRSFEELPDFQGRCKITRMSVGGMWYCAIGKRKDLSLGIKTIDKDEVQE